MVLDHLLPHLSQLGRGVCKMRIRSQIFLFVLDPGSPFRIHNHMRHRLRSYAYVFLFVFVYVMIIILMVPSVEKTNMRHWPRRYARICSPLLLQALSCHMEQIMPSTLRKLKSIVGSYKNKIWLHSFTIGYKVAFIFRYVLDALASGTSLYILFLHLGSGTEIQTSIQRSCWTYN